MNARIYYGKSGGIECGILYVLPFGCAAEISGYGNVNTQRRLLRRPPGRVNIMAACALTLLPKSYLDEMMLLFIWANVTIAAINMLPVLPLDGEE